MIAFELNFVNEILNFLMNIEIIIFQSLESEYNGLDKYTDVLAMELAVSFCHPL